MHSSPDVPSPHASPVSPAAHRPAPPGSRGTLLAIGACCALSGFSALLYLSAWTRQFTFVFGTSGLAVATVLAACMGGLAVGAWLVERYLDRVRKPVFVFGVLQFVAGIAAIAVPVLLLGTESLLVAVLGAQPGPPESTGGMTTALYLATSFLVVVIPTACMGATLPLLTRHVVRTRDQIGSRIGLLYATNTLGAVVGALAAGFLLFPNAGLYETLVVGAIVSVLAFAMAALIARSELRSGQHPPAWADDERSSRSRMPWRQRLAPGPGWILPLTLVSGAACFGYAVLWTRMLSHVIGASVHALAVMLASFLLGIALGSLASMPFTRSRTLAQSAFVVTQVAIAAVAAGVYWSLDAILPAGTDLAASIGVALIALLPAAIFMGATFPLAARILADDAEFAAAETARLYAWNTFGVAAGVLLVGLVIIPALRFEGAIQVLVVTNIALALVTALLFANPRLAWSAATAVLLGLAVLLLRPPVPDRLLAASPLDSSAQGAMRHYGVGQSASAVVFEHEGSLLLRTNGLPEANIDISGTPPRFRGDAWLSPLACIARPATKNMLVVGYGGGAAVDGVPPSVQSIDVIEPEPQVLAANAAVRTLRARDPLLDPRVNVIENDVHAALALTSRRYDAIVSQPSHPWSAGEAHLYTREFLHDARAHLAPGGVFVQSIGLGFIDEEMLRSLAATMLDVFPHVRIYRPDPDTLVFLGSPQPLDVEREMARRQDRPISQYPSHYARFGIHAHEDLLAALVADRDGAAALARGAPLVTGNHNRLASAGVHDRRVLSAATASRILTQYDPLQRRDTWVFNSPDFAVAVDYLARRIALFEARDPGVARRLQRLAGLTPGAAQQAYVAAISRRVAGDIQGSLRLLQESVALDPGFAAARFELLRGWLAALARGDAPAEVATMAEALPGSAAAVIEAARYANGGDWQKIPPLDPVLRTATWTDAWYLEAVQVRVEWRTRVTVAQMRARLGREALAILDEALVVQPVSPGLLALRAQAARSADEPEILMESLQEFAKGTVALSDQQRARQGAAPARDTAQAARMFDVLLEMLDGIADDKRIRAERHAAVRASVLRAREHVTQANREG